MIKWVMKYLVKVTLENILDKLTKDNISMDDVAIIAEGGEILMKI
jgi:hypothetical protein